RISTCTTSSTCGSNGGEQHGRAAPSSCALRRRLPRWVERPRGGRTVSAGTVRAIGNVATGAAPDQDAPHRLWEICVPQAARTWADRDTGDLQLPRPHAHLWPLEGGTVSAASAYRAAALDGQTARGENRPPATPAL